jgi:outer membrane protein assembly factor BamB
MMFASRTKLLSALVCLMMLSGCESVSDWFEDDEVLEIRNLAPIENKVNLNVRWEREVGNGIGDYFSRLQPQVAGDKVFAADRQGLVVAYNLAGEKVWQQRINTTDGSD